MYITVLLLMFIKYIHFYTEIPNIIERNPKNILQKEGSWKHEQVENYMTLAPCLKHGVWLDYGSHYYYLACTRITKQKWLLPHDLPKNMPT